MHALNFLPPSQTVRKKFVLAALALAAGSLSAQTLKGITVDKTQVEAGQTVTATVTLEASGTPRHPCPLG